jgi:SAM-dependent methyltransferase
LILSPPKYAMVDLSKQRLNYDKIAHLYDEPIRDYGVDPNLVSYLEQRGRDGRRRVLDLGCGTGKQLTADSQSLSGIIFMGMDLFSGMLRVAQRRGPNISWVQGDNAHTPFASDTFDYITNQFSYQHVQEQEKMIGEIYRLLRGGGRFVMNNIDPWMMREWLVYQFFSAAWELDAADFLPVETFTAMMETAGFRSIHISRRLETAEMRLGEVQAYVSRRTAASQLMAISDEAYADGLRKMGQAVERQGEDALIQSTFCFLTVIGDKS